MSSSPQLDQLTPVADRTPSLPHAEIWVEALLLKLWSALQWITRRVKVQQSRKSLRICENVSLGEKRFIAVVQVDDERFLIGGSSGSVSLLSRLQEEKTFTAVLDREAGRIS
jgi:flagellar biogenesis protein FliO